MGDERPCLLVVDDAPEFLEFMSMLLGAEGFEVAPARSLNEARALLARRTPHLVICDVQLVRHSAFAVLDTLRADERTRKIPILLCTGAVFEVEARAEELAEAGVEVLLKPFDIDDLLARVARLCGRPAAGKGHQAPA
jgi:DNA-binding response OmpR family regulator